MTNENRLTSRFCNIVTTLADASSFATFWNDFPGYKALRQEATHVTRTDFGELYAYVRI